MKAKEKVAYSIDMECPAGYDELEKIITTGGLKVEGEVNFDILSILNIPCVDVDLQGTDGTQMELESPDHKSGVDAIIAVLSLPENIKRLEAMGITVTITKGAK